VPEEFRNTIGDDVKVQFIERGEMEIKGKELMKTYHLEKI